MGAPDVEAKLGSWSVLRGIADDQVSAALELRSEHLGGWRASADLLYSMGREIPSNTLAQVLGKVAAVDSLYNAQVGRVLLMSNWIFELSQRGRLASGSSAWETVELIGFMNGASADGCHVFASKYAHFCIDPDAFAVLDKYAARTLLRHWGRAETLIEGRDRYRKFWAILERVLNASEPRTQLRTFGELDAYLWLAGVYREWLRDRDRAGILTECRQLFEAHSGHADEAGVRLARMVPDTEWLKVVITARRSS